MLANGMGKGT